MKKKEDNLIGICEKFEAMYWHDSSVINLRLIKYDEYRKYDLELDVDLYQKNPDGKVEKTRKILIFRNCRILQIDFDLLGLLFCGGNISVANCYEDAVQFEETRRGKFKHFDFPETFNPLEKNFVFSFEMLHPAGEIIVFARTFDILDSKEV